MKLEIKRQKVKTKMILKEKHQMALFYFYVVLYDSQQNFSAALCCEL